MREWQKQPDHKNTHIQGSYSLPYSQLVGVVGEVDVEHSELPERGISNLSQDFKIFKNLKSVNRANAYKIEWPSGAADEINEPQSRDGRRDER